MTFPKTTAIEARYVSQYLEGLGGRIRALSLWQPWATLVAVGAKEIETRSWAPTYRGPLAIHASRTWSRELDVLCDRSPFWQILHELGIIDPKRQIPRGAIVALAELEECFWVSVAPDRVPAPGSLEREFGDYRSGAGRVGWVLRNVQRVEPPIPARGAQGLWFWSF